MRAGEIPMKLSTQVIFYFLAILLAVYWVFLFISTHTGVHVPEYIPYIDKVMHFSAYGMLALALTSLIFFRWGLLPRIGIWVWTTTVLYGSIDEYTQQFVPDRNPDIVDLLADACGSALGIGIAYGLAYWWLAKRKQKQSKLGVSSSSQ